VSAAQVHATAIVHPGAQLAAGVSIGAYSLIGEHVVLGEGTWVGPHVVIEGHTRLGRNNRIYQFASIGAAPQDKKYAGEPTRVDIGDGNTIREGVTINRGTTDDGGLTSVGNDNWVMGSVHIAHDCHVGSRTIMANYTGLAGHVRIGDWAILGGATVVHQFVNIGAHSFTSMGTYLAQDLPPYVMAAGNTAKPFGINNEGLRRRGFTPAAIASIKQAYRALYRSGLGLEDAKRRLAELAAAAPEVRVLLEFLERSKRGFIR
jgi:UDP-N-acetylglucosamine acyltransferase